MASQPAYSGKIIFDKDIQSLRTEEIVRLGIIYVPEDRRLFKPLSVEENLLLGAYTLDDEDRKQANLEFVYHLFPALKNRRDQATATMSGGEQQMVAIGRGLMSNPKILMLDEPSLGLAPFLVDEVLDTVRRLKEQGLTILLVEQNVREALEISDRAYILQTGRIIDVGLELPDARARLRHALRRREPAHPPGLADRLGPDRRALCARRALDRPAPARQRAPARHAEAAARPRQHRARGRA